MLGRKGNSVKLLGVAAALALASGTAHASLAMDAPVAVASEQTTLPTTARPLAIKLIDTIQPTEDDIQLVEVGMKQMLTQLAKSYAPVARISKKYPGILDTLTDRTLPIAFPFIEKHNQRYRTELTELYSTQFNDEELSQLIAFWSSPAAQKALRGVTANISLEHSAKDAAANLNKGEDELAVSPETYDKDWDEAAGRAVNELTQSELAEMESFLGSTPLGQKYMLSLDGKDAIDNKYLNTMGTIKFLEPIMPELRRVFGEVIREYDPEFEPRAAPAN